jgi:AraC-like DNA-binding protein
MSNLYRVSSVKEIHDFLGIPGPKHPLISIIPIDEKIVSANYNNTTFVLDLFQISLKIGISGNIAYGRNSYDFQEGTMVFTKPNQSMKFSAQEDFSQASGWTLLFHPDLIRKSELGRVIDHYDFFSYDIHEALHVSEEEQRVLTEIVEKIKREYETIIDQHSQELINSNTKILLDYCKRYYDRQFYTRSNLNKDFVTRFERILSDYYSYENAIETGVPTVTYCGNKMNMSPHYLSDLLKKETGRSAQEHIYELVIDRAKTLLLATEDSISEIAYSLGFSYPNHFSKLFRSKTGLSPGEFRKTG